ncbi:Gfo/Idh/MocA family protein [Vagococcus vulneris]|uniref:Uncharacterized protein n=1 Tax=Vagococcus vulneris TaxID=1977869 RepID=A0A429ZWW6_9ENTE|nr:Gfo/Idh/MocA family oxidoreductase [Vagococcus vulneris]RST98312.1 hypothetical protein CBF37_08360 [Vagococcus vulneris]
MIKNIGVVGTGWISTEFVNQIDKKKYTIQSVFNRNPVSLEKFLITHKLPLGYTDYDDFIQQPALQVVYIGSPNQTHYDYAKRALLAGKHVLCEKVMVLTGEQSQELFTIAKERDLVLMEAVSLFYMPLYLKVQDLLSQNILGKLSSINVTFGSCKEFDPDNRFFSKEKGGGALFDIGTYALSAAVYLLGTDTELISSEVVMSETDVDEKSTTILKTATGELASVMISFRGKMPKQIILSGDQGYLVINEFPRATTGTIYLNDGEVVVLKEGDGYDVFNYEMDQLNELVKTGTLKVDHREVTNRVIHLMDDMRHAWDWEL